MHSRTNQKVLKVPLHCMSGLSNKHVEELHEEEGGKSFTKDKSYVFLSNSIRPG